MCSGGMLMLYKSFNSMINRKIDINILMFIAVVGAAAIQEFSESALVILIFLVSEYFENSLMRYVRSLLTNSIG
jgi:Cd2+/Zn2+-exporting ATPase